MSIADLHRRGGSVFVLQSALDLIGNTPLVDVSVLSPNPNVRIVAKLENQNPFGSVKDRIAKAMILDAEKSGRLVPGQRIIEPSSGNTGIALAAIAKMKGYPITIVMPTSVSIERRQMLEVFGADIILRQAKKVLMAQFIAPKNSHNNTQSGVFCISMQTMPILGRTTRQLVLRFIVTALKSRTLWPDLVQAELSWELVAS